MAKRPPTDASPLIPDRGAFVTSPLAPLVMATVHASSILRAPDDETRRDELKRFAADLRKVARALRSERQP
jgi:hypothetical protein